MQEGRPSCTYCKADLRTVRCHFCYQLNAAVGSFCSGCGRELGLEPQPTADARVCSDCGGSMSAFRAEPGALLDCSGCGVQFVEHALLVALLERREIVGGAVPSHAQRPNPLASGPVRYRPCPCCAALMNRKNFGNESGIIVDICHAHGTLFDAGELPRVLTFVASGGLARAEQREREKAARRARPAPPSPMLTASRETNDLEWGTEVAKAASELLAFIARKL